MQWGSLSSLAEVGVGVNLGLGMLQSFRGWLREKLAARVAAVVVRLSGALAEEQVDGKSALAEINKIDDTFATRAQSGERFFIGFALFICTVLLFLITQLSWNSAQRCPFWMTYVVLVAAVGPLLAWWIYLMVHYKRACNGLAGLEVVFEHALKMSKTFKNYEVAPRDPGSAAPRKKKNGSKPPKKGNGNKPPQGQ